MHRIFYGWWIALAVFVIYAIGGGFSFSSLTVYFGGFERTFDWSRTELSGAISVSFLISGLLGPFAGRAVDRRSARGIIAAGAIITGLSFVTLSLTSTVWMLYVAYLVMAVGRTGLNFVPLGTVLANWFVKKRGLAMGFTRVGAGLGGFVVAPLADFLITRLGLLSAFLIIALIVFAVLLPIIIFVIRQRPADMGLLPDGDKAEPGVAAAVASNADKSPPALAGVSLRDALLLPSFWLLALSVGLYFTGEVAVLMHAVPFFSDRGFSSADATRVISLISVASMAASMLHGFLADKFLNAKYLMALCCLLMCVATVLLWFASSAPMVWLFAITFGLADAGILTLQAVVVGESFGLRSFGEIFGVLSAITNVGTVLGPIIAGYLFDTSGSYAIALTLFFFLDLVAAALVIFVRPLSENLGRSRYSQSSVMQA